MKAITTVTSCANGTSHRQLFHYLFKELQAEIPVVVFLNLIPQYLLERDLCVLRRRAGGDMY